MKPLSVLLVRPRGTWDTHPVFRDHLSPDRATFRSGADIFFCLNIPLVHIAGFVAPPHRVRIVDQDVGQTLDWDALPERPDLLYLSPTATHQVCAGYEIAAAARARGIRTAQGGDHATALPEEVATHVDVVLVGDEEAAFGRLFADLVAGRTADRYVETTRTPVESLPFPRYDLLELERYGRIHVMAGRGCHVGCDFCHVGLYGFGKARMKSPARFRAELEAIGRLDPRALKRLLIADDNFPANRAESGAILEAIADLGARFVAYSDLSVGTDPRYLEKLRAAGCFELIVGLESLDVATLKTISPMKRALRERYLDLVAAIQEAGIAVLGSFVVGYDEDTEASLDAIRAFADEASLYEVLVSVLTPLPGTRAFARLEAEDRILSRDWARYTNWHVNIRPRNFTPEALEAAVSRLYDRLNDPETRTRRVRYWKDVQTRTGAAEARAGAPAPPTGPASVS